MVSLFCIRRIGATRAGPFLRFCQILVAKRRDFRDDASDRWRADFRPRSASRTLPDARKDFLRLSSALRDSI